jgi:hypothetical protein
MDSFIRGHLDRLIEPIEGTPDNLGQGMGRLVDPHKADRAGPRAREAAARCGVPGGDPQASGRVTIIQRRPRDVRASSAWEMTSPALLPGQG